MTTEQLSDYLGSCPSEILTPQDQALLFQDDDVGKMMNLIGNDDYHNENTYPLDDLKENFDYQGENKVGVPPVSNVLSNDEYPGPLEFEVCIYPNTITKNPWVYSVDLNKVFMDMSIPFPVVFKVKQRPTEALFIRATPMFSSPQHSQEFVTRCINHEHAMESSNRGILEHIRQHILRCKNRNTQYLGDKLNNERLSVVIPFAEPQMGCDSVTEIFSFVCKNSCPCPGMNRRPIEVIFTLETIRGEILGRRVLRVRICSCPKRDKEKEEKEFRDKPLPRGKKRKIDKPDKNSIAEVDFKEYIIPLTIVGDNNVRQVLKYCEDLMSGEILRHSNNNAPFKKCRNDISALLAKHVNNSSEN